jgi:hypothetical protein
MYASDPTLQVIEVDDSPTHGQGQSEGAAICVAPLDLDTGGS